MSAQVGNSNRGIALQMSDLNTIDTSLVAKDELMADDDDVTLLTFHIF